MLPMGVPRPTRQINSLSDSFSTLHLLCSAPVRLCKSEVEHDGLRRTAAFRRHDERWFNAEDRIAVQIPVPGKEEMCDQRPVSGSADHEMDVSRSKRMSTHFLQKLSCRTVCR